MQALPTLFRYTHSPTLPKLLWQLGCTLAFSTYQAGKVIFIRATSPEKIEQHALDFPRPMGLAVSDQRIAVATREEIVVLTNTSVEGSPESHYVDSGTGAVRNSAYQTGDAAERGARQKTRMCRRKPTLVERLTPMTSPGERTAYGQSTPSFHPWLWWTMGPVLSPNGVPRSSAM